MIIWERTVILFVRPIDHTLKSLQKKKSSKGGHVSGNELLEGIREYALERFEAYDNDDDGSLEYSKMQRFLAKLFLI